MGKRDQDDGATGRSGRWKVSGNLTLLKVLLFLIHGSMACLYPYLTLHMKSLGFSYTEIGLISLLVPFVSAIGPPVGGFLADKLGNYKIVLIGTTLMSIVFHLLLWLGVPTLIPLGAQRNEVLSQVNITLPCSTEGQKLHQFYAALPPGCHFDLGSSGHIIPQLTFQECTTDCSVLRRLSPNVCENGTFVGDCIFYKDLEKKPLANVPVTASLNGSLNFGRSLNPVRNQWIDIGCIEYSGDRECEIKCLTGTGLNVSCRSPVEPALPKWGVLTLYTVFRLLGGIAVSTIVPMLDSIAFVMAEEYKGDLGIQRTFTLFGMILMPPLSGYLNGVASQRSGYSDFSPAFYIFAGMQLLAALVTLCMAIGVRLPAQHILKNMGKIMSNPKVFVFVFMMLMAGIFWGFLENFLFIFMEEDLGAKKWMLGLTNTVSGVAALPVVAASTFFIKYLGHTKIIIFCIILYGIRFLSYAHIYNPFHVLPVEVLEAFTTSLLWVVASVYCGKVTPEYLGTLQGIVGAVHYVLTTRNFATFTRDFDLSLQALGRGLGCLIGGLMFEFFKARMTYIIFGWTCVATGALYAILHYAWLRRVKRPAPKVEEVPRRRVSLRRTLTVKEEKDVAEIAKFEGLSKTYSHFSSVKDQEEPTEAEALNSPG